MLPAYVLGLTVLDGASLDENGEPNLRSRVLIVVRDPQTNASHPNVVSVPTQRIPFSIFKKLNSDALSELVTDGSITFHQDEKVFNNSTDNGHAESIFVVNSLLAGKLGLADALERRLITYDAQVRATLLGTVSHPDYSELTAMINIVVTIRSGADLFPARTASYSHIMWSSLDNFLNGARTKDPSLLDSALDSLQYCIHGLCIKGAFNVVAERLGVELYPYDPYELE